jgi:adenine deaminase
MADLARRLAVARGDEPADLVVRGGRVLSVFTREWLETDVAIAEGYVAGLGDYEGTEEVDATGRFVVPGFIDAHMHLESPKLLPDEFARLVLPLGTTAVVADPHELANVLGTDGVHWLLDFCAELPLDVYFMASSSVPASRFESPRRALNEGDLQGLLRRRRVLGLAEMMNFPGVIAGDEDELTKLGLTGATHVDGHAPGVVGKQLNAYAAAGIRSDHETLTVEEGRERLRAGMWVLIREATMARNLLALLPLVVEYGTSRIAFCTDDKDPDDIAENGHINGMVRDAVVAGIAPEDALVLGSLNPALWHGLDHLGALAPGYQADVLVLPDLESFRPEVVLKRGRPVEEIARSEVPEWVKHTVRIGPVAAERFRIAWPNESRARVIGLVPDQVVTESLVEEPTVRDGKAVADPSRDLAKIAVIERHLGTGRVGLGFVRGFGLERGALGSTVAHDAHNLVVVGMNDADMGRVVERLGELGGGIVAVDEGEVLAELPLPVGGLLADLPLVEVVERSRACTEAAERLGCRGATPFLTMSFLALSVIPSLKITDQGLVDVDRFELVPLEAEGPFSPTPTSSRWTTLGRSSTPAGSGSRTASSLRSAPASRPSSGMTSRAPSSRPR